MKSVRDLLFAPSTLSHVISSRGKKRSSIHSAIFGRSSLAPILFHNPNRLTREQAAMHPEQLVSYEEYQKRLKAYKRQMRKLGTTGETGKRLRKLQRKADQFTRKRGVPRIKIHYGQNTMFYDTPDPEMYGDPAITVNPKDTDDTGFYHEVGHWADFKKRGKAAHWEKRLRRRITDDPKFDTPERRRWLVAEEKRAWEAVPKKEWTPQTRWKARMHLDTYIKGRRPQDDGDGEAA